MNSLPVIVIVALAAAACASADRAQRVRRCFQRALTPPACSTHTSTAPHTPAASWPRVDTTTVPTTVAAAGGKRPASAPPPEPNAATPRRGSRQRGLPLRQLESHLGYSFSQPALLEQACTHSPDKQVCLFVCHSHMTSLTLLAHVFLLVAIPMVALLQAMC